MDRHLTFDQLPRAVTELLTKVEKIESLLQDSAKAPEAPERLNAKEASKYLNIALPTLYGLVSNRKIKHYKSGKKLSFLRSDLEDYLNKGKRLTAKEMADGMKRKQNNKKGLNYGK